VKRSVSVSKRKKERQKAIRVEPRERFSLAPSALLIKREDESTKPSEKRERDGRERKTCDSTYYLTNIVHKRLIFDY
jgi:hypothetical protein